MLDCAKKIASSAAPRTPIKLPAPYVHREHWNKQNIVVKECDVEGWGENFITGKIEVAERLTLR